MSEKEQIEHLDQELIRLIERFRKEYNLSYASVIGTLHLRAHILAQEAIDSEK